jgi:hypothetical protein
MLLRGEVLALVGLHALERLEGDALLLGKAERGGRRLARGVERGRDGRTGDRFVEIFLALRHPADARRQAARRAEALDRHVGRQAHLFQRACSFSDSCFVSAGSHAAGSSSTPISRAVHDP